MSEEEENLPDVVKYFRSKPHFFIEVPYDKWKGKCGHCWLERGNHRAPNLVATYNLLQEMNNLIRYDTFLLEEIRNQGIVMPIIETIKEQLQPSIEELAEEQEALDALE